MATRLRMGQKDQIQVRNSLDHGALGTWKRHARAHSDRASPEALTLTREMIMGPSA
jgi:hypothetical protein